MTTREENLYLALQNWLNKAEEIVHDGYYSPEDLMAELENRFPSIEAGRGEG